MSKLEQVENKAKQLYQSYYDTYYRWHIVPVKESAEKLLDKAEADAEVVRLAALLHDIGKVKHGPEDHHLTSEKEAEKILQQFDYEQEVIERVKYCIKVHRGSVDLKRETIESKVVASADALSHFDTLPFLFYTAYEQANMSAEEGVDWIKSKLKRDWQQKMMPEAQEIIKDKYEAIKRIL